MACNQKFKVRFLLMYSFLRYLIQRVSPALTPGIVIVTEDRISAKQLQINLVKTGMADKYKAKSKEQQFFANFKMAVTILEENERDILNFLETVDFLPVVIAPGLAPKCIEDGMYVLRMDSEIEETTIKEFCEFQVWMLEHLEVVIHEFKVVAADSMTHKLAEKISLLYSVVIILADILAVYLKDKFSDKTIAYSEANDFLDAGKKMIEDQEALTGLCPIAGAVRYLMNSYLRDGKSCIFKDIELKDDCIGQDVAGITIFYDENWYYIPHDLLKDICISLREKVSFRQIKEELLQEGVLDVSEWSASNYTIQKTVYIDNESVRLRFLKLLKEAFLSDDEMPLEDAVQSIQDNREESSYETGSDEEW